MHNRSAKLLLAVSAGAIASVAITASPLSSARADTCLPAPNAPTPVGSHWFYRADHANKRKCWYLRKADAAPAAASTTEATPLEATDTAEGAPAPATNSPAPSPKAKTAAASSATQPTSPAPSTAAPLRSSVADARAEFAAPQQPQSAAPAAINSPFPAPVLTAPGEATQAAAAPAPAAEPSTTAAPTSMNDRWSDSSAGNVQANTDVTDKLRKAAKATKSAPASITEGSMSAGTLATLIGALLAALAVAGGIAAALMKFGRSEPIVRREPGGRPDLWAGRTERDTTDIYANDFRSSPIDLDATFRKPAAPPAVPSASDQDIEPPAWIKAARERHVANDRIRPGGADFRAAEVSAAKPQRTPDTTDGRAHETAPPTADEIEQLLALAQKRSAA